MVAGLLYRIFVSIIQTNSLHFCIPFNASSTSHSCHLEHPYLS